MRNLIIKHAIITPKCREGRGVREAFEEAMNRLKDQYYESLEHYPDANFHLKLELEKEPK